MCADPPSMMSTPPLVSIITPFLDMADFLTDSIESVLAQHYSNWELLLVDDGSSDGSSEIARRFANRHPGQIHYLEHPGHAHRGATTSRNLGIGRARGGYLALLDADDVWLPHKLVEQVAILEANPEAGMVYGQARDWSTPGEEMPSPTIQLPQQPLDRVIRPPTLLLDSYPLGPGPAPSPSDLLLRRSVVERVEGFEEEFQGILQLYEDQAFLAKIYLTTPVFVSGSCWTLYRQHPDSCVARVRRMGMKHAVRLYYLQWLTRYLRRQGALTPTFARAIRRCVRRTRYPWFYQLPARLRGLFHHPLRSGHRLLRRL